MFARAILFALAAIAGTAKAQSAGCGLDPIAGGHKIVDVNGVDREYILGIPEDYHPNELHRFIIVFHGLTGIMEDAAESGYMYLEPFDTEGTTVFIAPQGLDEGLGYGWYNTDGRDYDFVDVMVENTKRDLCIDETKVFAAGFSFGGGMSFALACARPGVFRGIGINGGADLVECDGSGTTPTAFFGTHGVADDTVSYDRGEALRDHYLEVNGCAPKVAPTPEPGEEYILTKYDCDEGFPVWWMANGEGHVPGPQGMGGEMWTFFTEAV